MSEITLQADIDAVLTLGGVNLGGFQVITGGEESAEVVDDFPPGSAYADKSVGKATLGNITVNRTWREQTDRALYEQIKGKLGLTGTCGRLVRDKARNISGQDTFTVKLIRNKGPEGDTNAGNAKATWEMELAVTGLK
jgi:hypothetical protein